MSEEQQWGPRLGVILAVAVVLTGPEAPPEPVKDFHSA